MERAKKIFTILRKEYPQGKTALEFGNPLQILIATILSAQCTDKRVNMVTEGLFKKYKTAKDFANARQKEFERAIKSTGFYKNKAQNIINSARLIMERFHGRVPKTMEDLLKLPGVARKTANIVLYSGYGLVEGIAVDTHVRRVSQRLGLTKNNDPVKIEQDLMELIPKRDWGRVSHFLIDHGRKACQAKRPDCLGCVLKKLCPSFGKF